MRFPGADWRQCQAVRGELGGPGRVSQLVRDRRRLVRLVRVVALQRALRPGPHQKVQPPRAEEWRRALRRAGPRAAAVHHRLLQE